MPEQFKPTTVSLTPSQKAKAEARAAQITRETGVKCTFSGYIQKLIEDDVARAEGSLTKQRKRAA